jgi:hypothetical protein
MLVLSWFIKTGGLYQTRLPIAWPMHWMRSVLTCIMSIHLWHSLRLVFWRQRHFLLEGSLGRRRCHKWCCSLGGIKGCTRGYLGLEGENKQELVRGAYTEDNIENNMKDLWRPWIFAFLQSMLHSTKVLERLEHFSNAWNLHNMHF